MPESLEEPIMYHKNYCTKPGSVQSKIVGISKNKKLNKIK